MLTLPFSILVAIFYSLEKDKYIYNCFIDTKIRLTWLAEVHMEDLNNEMVRGHLRNKHY